MTESMIERVARAIDDASDENSIAFLPHSGGPRDEFVEKCRAADLEKRMAQARAAIEAMREPTDAMIDAACGARVRLYPAWEGQKPQPTAGEVIISGHHAMIDAALQWPPGSADRAGVPMALD